VLPSPPAAAIAECDAVVDLSQCRYAIVESVACRDMEWYSAVAPGSALPGGASHHHVPSSSYGSFDSVVSGANDTTLPSAPRKVPLVIWSDLSVTPQRLLALHHALPQAPWASCLMVNHFPAMTELCRKRPMAEHLARSKGAFPNAYRFVPESWPSYDAYSAWVRSNTLGWTANGDGRGVPVIVKPSAGCMGKGITVARAGTPQLWQQAAGGRSPSASSPTGLASSPTRADRFAAGDGVVQQYIDRPLLVDGRKFDLRCYVFIASVDPWRVYFAKDGLVRLCNKRFERPSATNEGIAEMHLTNFAVNKTSDAPGSSPHKEGSPKRPIRNSNVAVDDSTPEIRYLCSAPTSCEPSCGAKQTFRFAQVNLQAVCEERELVRAGHMPPYDDLRLRREALQATLDGEVCHGCCHYHAKVIAAQNAKRRLRQGLPAEEAQRIQAVATAAVEHVWGEIHLVALKALWTVVPRVEEATRAATVHVPGRATAAVRCFELLGYDIMLDVDLQPWLIEVNHSPSWTASGLDDELVKRKTIAAVLRALCVERHHLPLPTNAGSQQRRRGTPSSPAKTGNGSAVQSPASARPSATVLAPSTPPNGASDLSSPPSTPSACSTDATTPPASFALSFGAAAASLNDGLANGSSRAAGPRRARTGLLLPPAEYHALLSACEAEALGDDFERLYPPPDWVGIAMQPGGADPVSLTPYERRQIAEQRASSKAKRPPRRGPCPPSPQTAPTTRSDAQGHRAALRAQWAEAMLVFEQQREAARIRRGGA
jgi:hypothetical protein